MIAILAACVAMAAQDCLGTLLVIAEARGRRWLAGVLDMAGDWARIACTVVGAGTVITDGITAHSVEVVLAMSIVSLVGTSYWTKIGDRIRASGTTAKQGQ